MQIDEMRVLIAVLLSTACGATMAYLLCRTTISTLRQLLCDSERRSEAHQRLLVQVSRELCHMEHLENPLHPEKPDEDDQTSAGCGGGEDERAKAWARENADAEAASKESFAETLMSYGMSENYR